jgi:murein DD-endopeptidase MepM/ murein hydrolase activator NlpD
MKTPLVLLILFFFLLLQGCTPSSSEIHYVTPPYPSTTFTTVITPSSTPNPTETPSPSPTIEVASHVCSPLQGIPLEKLRLITSNTFKPFPPYIEDGEGHPAIDFSFYQFEGYSTFENFPIQSILPGRVILIENDRYPYGFMVLIETPVSQIDSGFFSTIPRPTPLPESNYSIGDRCPVQGKPVTYDPTSESIYVLYAHLSSLPSVQTGDLVSCGELIGFAGKTGNAAEDHLHLELRLGPSNVAFNSIASYQASATIEERYNYCIWSLSGVFRAIDPAVLLYPK